jgi:hypothetical protein
MAGQGTGVAAEINFAANPDNGGKFSNLSPDRVNVDLLPQERQIRNGRDPRYAPALAREGLAIVTHAAGESRWSEPDWVTNSYVPSCVELVKRLSGARDAMQLFIPLQRYVNQSEVAGAALTAAFAHLDFPRDFAREAAEQHARDAGVRLGRAVVYNVWKCITPPPQDVPLTVGDRNSVGPADFVWGETLEYNEDGSVRAGAPYYLLRPSANPTFYYFPEMEADESLVFVGADLDSSNPLGCPHCAFRDPSVSAAPVPRASIEVRVLAIFD